MPINRRLSIVVALACALAACGGGGGSGGGTSIPSGPNSTPTPGTTATPTPIGTATPTPSGTATPTPSSGNSIQGKIVDAASGNPIAGITIAVTAPTTANAASLMASSSAPNNAAVLTGTTASDGTFSIPCGTTLQSGGTDYCANSTAQFYLSAYGGASYGNNSIHGYFGGVGYNYGVGGSGNNAGTLKLTNPTAEEITLLAHVNAFRAAPGPGNTYGQSGATYPQYSSNTLYGVNNNLVFDESLVEIARYWANEQHVAGHMGHTCATLVTPPAGCVDPTTYGRTLPGESSTSFGDSENVASGFVSWTCSSAFVGTATCSAESALEIEGNNSYSGTECATIDDAKTCTFSDPPAGASHFINEMSATRWAGFGSVETSFQAYDQELI